MKLYYSGAATFLAPQTIPYLSLGGFVSSSEVPNGSLNNLFGSLSESNLRKPRVERRAVVLKNETGLTANNINIYYENHSQEPLTYYKMALVALAQDDCGDWYMEKIGNVFATPLNAVFTDNRGSSNALVIPSLAPDQYMGVWIERHIISSQVGVIYDCDALHAKHLLEEAAEVTEVTFPVATGLGGTYWEFDTPEGSYYVWYTISGVGVDPAPAGRDAINIDLLGPDTAIDVATKTNAGLSLLSARGEISTVQDNDKITITNLTNGDVTDAVNKTTGVTINITTQGVSRAQELQEDVDIVFSW